MTAVGILGGVPAYLRRFDAALDVEANVHQAILGIGAPLLAEPRFLMMEELREPQLYFSLCRAIAHGHGRPNEIAQAAGLTGNEAKVPAVTADLKRPSDHVDLALFSRSGFTPELRMESERRSVLLFTVEDVLDPA